MLSLPWWIWICHGEFELPWWIWIWCGGSGFALVNLNLPQSIWIRQFLTRFPRSDWFLAILKISTEYGSGSSVNGKLCLGPETVNSIESITRKVVLVIISHRPSLCEIINSTLSMLICFFKNKWNGLPTFQFWIEAALFSVLWKGIFFWTDCWPDFPRFFCYYQKLYWVLFCALIAF